MVVEVGSITMSGAATGSFTFTQVFPSAPVISAITVDTTVTDSANVNVYVVSVSTTSVTFRTSAAMTGKIHFQAVHVA